MVRRVWFIYHSFLLSGLFYTNPSLFLAYPKMKWKQFSDVRQELCTTLELWAPLSFYRHTPYEPNMALNLGQKNPVSWDILSCKQFIHKDSEGPKIHTEIMAFIQNDFRCDIFRSPTEGPGLLPCSDLLSKPKVNLVGKRRGEEAVKGQFYLRLFFLFLSVVRTSIEMHSIFFLIQWLLDASWKEYNQKSSKLSFAISP